MKNGEASARESLRKPARGVGRLWSWIVEPPAELTDAKVRRRARLLSGLLFVFVVSNTAGAIATPADQRWINILLLLAFIALYGVSRTRARWTVAPILIACLVATFFVALFANPSGGRHLFTALAAWQMISLLVAQIFLDTFGFLIVVLLIFAVVVSAPWWSATASGEIWAGVGLVSTASSLMLVYRRHRDGIERDRLREIADAKARLEIEAEARQNALVAAEAATLAKSRFLANMSHELRTPLNAVVGYIEMVLEGQQDEPVLHPDDLHALSGSLKASKHLVALIGEILDLTKIEAGKLELHVEQCVLETLIGEIQALAKPLAWRHENRLEVKLEAAGSLHTDPVFVRQVLLNLLGNACKFTERGQVQLTVRALEREGTEWIELEVQDTGIGIAEAQLDRIFEAFTQVDDSSTRRYGGTGLGLSVTRRLVELLGGSIRAESVVGEGSRITVTIPRDLRCSPP